MPPRVLAERWGGSVRLDDRPEGGTCAEVLLPVIREHAVVAS
jgi:signal transduction histidine kinase